VVTQGLDEVTGDIITREYRAPKVATLRDPGRPQFIKIDPLTGQPVAQHPTYLHSSSIDSGPGVGNLCLSFVRGVDFSPINADPELVVLFPDDYEDADNYLTHSMNFHGWQNSARGKLRAEMAKAGFVPNRRGGDDEKLEDIIDRLGLTFHSKAGRPSKNWVR